MKNLFLFIVVQCCTLCSFSQINPGSPWVWMKGDNTVDQFGLYGVQGIPGSTNKPGARNISSTWKDGAGNLWMLGGYGYGAIQSGFLNDLWRFEPAINKWTWVKGSSDPDQYPVYGARGIAAAPNSPGGIYCGISWVDNSGKFWLLGGYGNAENGTGMLNTLWKYDPVQSEWTWISGNKSVNETGRYGIRGVADPLNQPGARYCSRSWTDSNGDLWLYGGYGYGHDPGGHGTLNDIWKYSVTTNEWTWIKGDSTINATAVYGTKGVTATTNNPGSRYMSTSWVDQDGSIWIYGGQGYDENDPGMLNDLWKYNSTTNQWTWINGNNIVNQAGHYGIQGQPAPANQPGSRYIASAWTDLSGEFWLFGGYGYDTSQTGYLNDLWRYNTITNQWTWAKGDNVIDQLPVYGTQGLPDSANKSGSRMSGISWTDGIGNLWLFGGYGYASNSSGNLNDLWKINSDQMVLPLSLLNFSGVHDNGMVRLQWQTEQEKGFSHYNIQRSFDGVHFSTIGNQPGNGNTSRSTYTWPDDQLKNQSWQKVFYRLQSVDKNGHFSYSKVILFKNDKSSTAGMSLFPNPAINSLNISFLQDKAGEAHISVYDAAGSIVKQQTTRLSAGRISLSIDVSALPAAAYIITVTNTTTKLQEKFIKR